MVENRNKPLETEIKPVINPNQQSEVRTIASPISPYLSLSQRLASFEYSDTGGDSGYVDLYPDVDSDESEESSDEEHEYEIQVSDSDSDSPDERGGSFYGVTALDTIFEEFESDVEDDAEDNSKQFSNSSDKGHLLNKLGRYDLYIPSDREVKVDNGGSLPDITGIRQTEYILNDNLKPEKLVQSDSQNSLHETVHYDMSSEIRTVHYPLTQNTGDAIKPEGRSALQNIDRIVTSQAEISEYRVSPDILSSADDTNKSNKSPDSSYQVNIVSTDYNVNNLASFNSGISHQNSSEGKAVTGQLSNISSQDQITEIGVKQRDTENNVSQSNTSTTSALQIEFLKLQERMRVPKLGQLQKDVKSDLVDDNSPSSPVRNVALDILADDRFSDTESCSSESVITVISVKSTESENIPVERRDVTRDSCITPVHSTEDMAAGESDQLANINMSDSSYEHNSLVSGFLNDSLNSLLSANNINEMEDDSDIEISEIEPQESLNFEMSENSQLESTLPVYDSEKVADDTGSQSEASSKTSSADSLSIVLARVQETNQINTELSNQAANKTAPGELRIESRISEALKSRDLRILDDNDNNDRFIESDSSSDSSDPPLREYDPDDDDLAAFQFNQDIDNDSFYLLVGDEGSLRNYETFTNLNSIGLASEYSDAFTSRPFSDEARGFTFSKTEDLGTQFRTQGYFTARTKTSDSDSHSDKGLSPIASEDEEITCLPESEAPLLEREKPTEALHFKEIQNSYLLSKYKDAELSGVQTSVLISDSLDSNEKKSIDFQKYIIQPERKAAVIKSGDKEAFSSQDWDTDSEKIDQEFKETKTTVIDSDRLNSVYSGVNTLNNEVDTNFSRVPCVSSTATTEQLSKNSNSNINESVGSDVKVAKETCAENAILENDDTLVQKNNVGIVLAQKETESAVSSGRLTCSTVETDIDDVFEETSRNDTKSSPGLPTTVSHSRETNIDDIFDDQPKSAEFREPELIGNSKISKPDIKLETNIDDIFDNDNTHCQENDHINSTKTVTHASKIETNVDSIFDEISSNKITHVQLTPFKQKPEVETNIDDIASEITFDNTLENNKTSHRKSVETFVDDLFSDIGLDGKEVIEKVNVDKQEKVKNEVNANKLSYETFVDDLFSDVLSPEEKHSSLTVDSGIQSSQSAIKPEIASDFRRSVKVKTPERVQEISPEVYSSQHLPPDKFKYSSLEQIDHAIETNKTNDPERDFYYDNRSLSQIDNVPRDLDSDKDRLNVLPLSRVECQNTQSIQLGSSNANLRREEIGLTDSIEPQICTQSDHDGYSIPNAYRKNNSRTIDNTGEDNDLIAIVNNRENNKATVKSKTEIEKAIIDAGSETKLSWNASNVELNGQKLQVIDYNDNVPLPKGGGLNIVLNYDNRGGLGLHPEENNCTRTSPLSVESTAKIAAPSGKQYVVDKTKVQTGATDASDTVLKIGEDSEPILSFQSDSISADQDNLSSTGSCSIYSDDESLSSIEESYNNLKSSYDASRARVSSDSSVSRIDRSPVIKPSKIFSKTKDYQGIKRRIHRHHLKKYTSVLQQPITTESQSIQLVEPAPEKPVSATRLKVLQSRQRFLSAENLSNTSFEDRFLQYRTSLTSSTPRKYLKRHERALADDLQSTESLPADMSAMDFMNSSYGSYSSMDRIHSLPVSRQIDQLYNSRYSSANSSFERHEYDKLHKNCIFSPEKREEIRHTTKSLENMFEQLLRYGSVSSLAETDLDAAVASQPGSLPPDIDITDYVSFQYPLERAASMSALTGSSEGHRLPRKPGKGRFASRNVQKSKSLQTLETNLDDVFAAEDEIGGELKKTPSVHELRVSKSLSKLNVPDWFRKSSFSRSGSTQSLFTYASRQGSTSTLGSSVYPASITTSPSPSVTPGSNAVIITKRVTATPSTPSTAKLLRAPLLPTTPEKSPIHSTSPSLSLPSDKFRKNEKKELKPIAIVPFAKLREMFEKKAQADAQSKSPVTSPSKEKPPSKVRFEPSSPVKEPSHVTFQSPSRETVIDNEPVQNNRTISPPPPIPERKPILAEVSRKSESIPSNAQPRKMQVHFSDEKPPTVEHVSKSQEQHNSNNVRHNGAAPSTNITSSKDKPPAKKPQSLRASLPQFRFKRPGVFATKASSSSAQSSNSQSKKGKNSLMGFYDKHDCGYCDLVCNDACVNNSGRQEWLHVLEYKTKIDGETLFEFLQKRRYSSILENGFAEQLEELQDRDVAFNFPVLSLGKHSDGDVGSFDQSNDLQVVLTNAYSNNSAPYDYMNNKLRTDATMDDILDGLLLLDGHRTGRLRMDEHGRIVPKHAEDISPDTPPGFVVKSGNLVRDMYIDSNENWCEETESEYILVKCENRDCKRETNLKEAKQYFKTCHSCFTYYCSRQCRKEDWTSHKKICIYSRINSACKHVIKFINRQPELQYQCSRIARRGYLAQGRGCVMFAFPDISSSEDFLNYGFECLWVPPVYISLRELPNASMLGSKLETLTDTCLHYNPELKYVIHVAIVIPPKLPVRPVPRKIESIIQKSAKLRLSPAHMHPRQESSEIPSTLILTAVPGNQHVDDPDERKTRELCFINIQRKLRQRGVSLRHQFPDVYNKLIDFVSDAKHFSPMIIYPSDGRTGRKFMCVIMPESEPEIEWIRDPNLFHELDVFEDEEIATPNLSLNLQEVLL